MGQSAPYLPFAIPVGVGDDTVTIRTIGALPTDIARPENLRHL
jgi:hypothetical protein